MPKIVDKEEKRAEILDAAIRTFAKKGTGGAKIEDIAKEAGVGKGTVYLYFKNKEEILQHILMQKAPAGKEVAHKILMSSKKPEEKLKELFKVLAADIENQSSPPEIQFEIFANLVRGPHKENLSIEATLFRDTVAEIVQQIKGSDKRDCQMIAAGLLSLIHGVMMMWVIDKESFPIREMTEKTVETLIDGLKKEK
ncbi:MAG: TetR/AcrR family transcriptional regulator [Desulfobacterales bacterium]|nr:TetR/AcrR family transcriptional regulator [Desulfobacterales bacterium]MCP4158784.1 TetR/AcrR family transcriptional regulator [Deltaproteobacteria bacterium]